MNISATRIGKIFHLNGQEMNAVLCRLGILEGEPGNYALTEFGKQYGDYYEHDNGYGGYGACFWETISYDESIIDWLQKNINKEVVREAMDQLKAHRIAQRAARAAEQEELLRKQQEEAKALAEVLRRQQNIRTGAAIAGGVVTVVLIAGVTWFCIHRSRKKKREAEREKLEKERAMEMAMNAYYYENDNNTTVDTVKLK